MPAISIVENTHLFGESGRLFGVVSQPAESRGEIGKPGVLLLNSGLIHHVGPNRLYVQMARRLAEKGFTTLRFDFSGIGDSESGRSALPLEKRLLLEISEAMDFLGREYSLNRFILGGICSGADVSLKAVPNEPRLDGALLIDWHAYFSLGFQFNSYRKQVIRPSSWLNLFRGRSRVWQAWRNTLSLKRMNRDLDGSGGGDWTILKKEQILDLIYDATEKGVRLYFIYSSEGPSLYNFKRRFELEFRALAATGNIDLGFIHGADHGFTLLEHQQALCRLVCNWAEKYFK